MKAPFAILRQNTVFQLRNGLGNSRRHDDNSIKMLSVAEYCFYKKPEHPASAGGRVFFIEKCYAS